MHRTTHRSTGRHGLIEPGDEELRRNLAIGISEDFGDLLPVGSVGLQIEAHANPVVPAEARDEEALRILRNEFLPGAGGRGGPQRDMSFVEAILLGVDELGERQPAYEPGLPAVVSPSVTSGSARHSRRTPASRSSVAGGMQASLHHKAGKPASTLMGRVLICESHSDLAARRGGGL